jgi:uncharacterized repeat protein (TIGR03803 family)
MRNRLRPNSLGLVRCILSIGVAAVFASCGGSQPALRPMTEMQDGASPYSGRLGLDYEVLFSFDRVDGAGPGALLDESGTLYGTTANGGTRALRRCTADQAGCGTVFRITTAGKERVLYSFVGLRNGELPNRGLLELNGTFYGTTYAGGNGGTYCISPVANKTRSLRPDEKALVNTADGCGTVFDVTTAGKERVLHRFAGGDDGSGPNAGLADVNATLYGTTGFQGKHRQGTVFSITPGGKETVLYSFGDKPSDGNEPAATLLDVNGTLYGTTYQGGTGRNCSGSAGCGTVFSITTAGKETVLYSFAVNQGDGAYPEANLIDVGGTLYGVTSQGGAHGLSCSGGICGGTVFSVTTAGKEQVVHSFTGSPGDGSYPIAGLLMVKGKLYGTTYSGGRSVDGTVFALTTAGKERILYSFAGMPDGANPNSGLVDVNGALYGTTSSGGSDNWGTVFSLKP